MNLWPLSRVEVRSYHRLYHLYWFSRNDLHIRILQSLLPCFAHAIYRIGWERKNLFTAMGGAVLPLVLLSDTSRPSKNTTIRWVWLRYPFTVPQTKKLSNSQAFSLFSIYVHWVVSRWNCPDPTVSWNWTWIPRMCESQWRENWGKFDCQKISHLLRACDRNLSGDACVHLRPSLGPGSSTAGSILYRASPFWGLAIAPMNCLRRILPH